MNKWRKAISLTALWAFVLLILTSIILYIVPAGRVAYWADWRLWGLTKTQWGELHINLGVLLLAAVGLHIYLNWKPILSYMKTKTRQLRIFTRDFNVAMAVALAVMSGTYLGLPPFSTVIAVSNAIKDAAAEKYGEPPYGHAELATLKTFSARMGWNLNESLQRLKKNGYPADDPQMTLLDVAVKQGVAPQQVFLAMRPVESQSARQQIKLPHVPPPGIGRQTLADICQTYDFNISNLIRALSAEKVNATAEQSIKEIADQHKIAPQDLYGRIKRITDKF